MKHQTPKQAAYFFFLRNAGFGYDPAKETRQAGRSRCARELAKAERDAAALGYTFEWRDDWSVDHKREFDYDPSTCEYCVCYDSTGTCVASLSCIDDATREYRRVIEAELASEALASR